MRMTWNGITWNEGANGSNEGGCAKWSDMTWYETKSNQHEVQYNDMKYHECMDEPTDRDEMK